MIKKFLERYRRSFKYYGSRSSEKFVKYLRNNGAIVGNNVKFRYPKHTKIDLTRSSLIEIGNNLDINDNFTIMTHDFGTYVFRNLYGDFVSCSGKVKLGNNIYIGRDVTILKGVEIGDNCIIGLGSIVTKNIPANSVAVGVPAKVVCSIEEYYEKRKKQQVEEALDYAVARYKQLGRRPKITDFREEWTVFISKEDMRRYPEILPEIKFRLRERFEKFFLTPPVCNLLIMRTL